MHELLTITPTRSLSFNARYYRHLLNACGKSVLFAAACFSAYGFLVGGLAGTLSVFLLAIVIGVFPMCGVLLSFLPIVWMSKSPRHPAFFSLFGMFLFTMISVSLMALLGMLPKPGQVSVEVARLVLFSLLYGAPIGFFLRASLAKDPLMAEHR